MRILLFATSYNGLCQRIHQELIFDGHQLDVELSDNPMEMYQSFLAFKPKLVVCPFLKHRVPEKIWQEVPCLVVHPGIAGDRGPSSLDWAIIERNKTWGTTLLQANQDFDAGKIWATQNFDSRATSKANLYRREVTSSASKMVRTSVAYYQIRNQATPTVDTSLQPKGAWHPLMEQPMRAIDWNKDDGQTIVDKINAADSFPGVKDQINDVSVYLFGAKFEPTNASSAIPGEIIGQKDEAICRACKDGLVWIKQMKLAPTKGRKYYKLPAMRVVNTQLNINRQLPHIESTVQSDIKVDFKGQTAYLHFDFYNGAFSTEQCRALLAEFRILESNPGLKTIVLMGGQDFWSNGIHLNCIHHAQDPAIESWRNINAINDLVEAIINCTSKITVAALRSNAGAGGAIVPLACDYVIAREGIVLNPHYKLMGLPGSEYWTYLLPKRVGKLRARKLMNECLPVITEKALDVNLIDHVLSEDWKDFHELLFDYCERLSKSEDYRQLIKTKVKSRRQDEKDKPLQSYRTKELALMKSVFNDESTDYHRLRHNFVYKIVCGKTPSRLRAKKLQEKIQAVS